MKIPSKNFWTFLFPKMSAEDFQKIDNEEKC